jgi:hypothetical protein
MAEQPNYQVEPVVNHDIKIKEGQHQYGDEKDTSSTAHSSRSGQVKLEKAKTAAYTRALKDITHEFKTAAKGNLPV